MPDSPVQDTSAEAVRTEKIGNGEDRKSKKRVQSAHCLRLSQDLQYLKVDNDEPKIT
jgi:hypothetical protein